jgi:hypothetical protein
MAYIDPATIQIIYSIFYFFLYFFVLAFSYWLALIFLTDLMKNDNRPTRGGGYEENINIWLNDREKTMYQHKIKR